MRGIYQALLDRLSPSQRHHEKFQEDVAVQVGTTSIRFWWTNTAFFSPPHMKQHVDGCIPGRCFFFGGYYLADMGSFFMGVEEFARTAAMSTSKLADQYPDVDVTWHLPHAVHPSKSKKPYDVVNSWTTQREFRENLKREFVKSAPKVSLLDPFEMTKMRVELTVDGNHYSNEINFMKLDMWLTSVCDINL